MLSDLLQNIYDSINEEADAQNCIGTHEAGALADMLRSLAARIFVCAAQS